MRTNNRVHLTHTDRKVLATLEMLEKKGNKHAGTVARFIRLGGKTTERASKIAYVFNPGLTLLGLVDYLRGIDWEVRINPPQEWVRNLHASRR